jgi:RNA polymerase subunit RPABC4/transcription elongation factor Spt4
MEEFQQILNLIEQSFFFKALKLSGWAILIASWMGMVAYTVKDGAKRYSSRRSQILVALLPLFFHLFGFLVYLFIRPAQTKAEIAYEKELLGLKDDLMACPSCGAQIREDFVFCQLCGSELFEHCPNCGKPVKKGWKYCPYCRKKL